MLAGILLFFNISKVINGLYGDYLTDQYAETVKEISLFIFLSRDIKTTLVILGCDQIANLAKRFLCRITK